MIRRWGVLAAAVAVAAAGVEFARTSSGIEAVEALVAALVAVAVAGLAATLPGVRADGLALGAVFVVAGVFTWTHADRPIVIWTVLAAGGVWFLVAGRPWLAGGRALPRLGVAWLGLAYWALGAIGAALVGHGTVAAQRIVYLGVFGAAALVVVALVAQGRDLTPGIAAALLLGLAALLLAGSGSVFDAVHAVPDSPSARDMPDRFWGGPGLYYHPNSMAGLAVLAAVRIAADRAFGAWHRYGAGALACAVLVLSDSRTGFLLAGAAAVVHAVLLLRRRAGAADLPDYRRRWLAALTPFVALAVVLAVSGGAGFLLRQRFTDSGVSTGRVDTWRQVMADWRRAGPVEKLLGDATTARAVVTRANDGAPPEGPRRRLNTDNAAVGALRRGGVLGVLAFLLGLVLLLRHAFSARAAWFTIAVFAMVPTIATEDWLLGGTNGAIWTILLAGEAHRIRAGRAAKWMAPIENRAA